MMLGVLAKGKWGKESGARSCWVGKVFQVFSFPYWTNNETYVTALGSDLITRVSGTHRQYKPYLCSTSEVRALQIVALVYNGSMSNPPFFNVQCRNIIFNCLLCEKVVDKLVRMFQIICHKAIRHELNKLQTH